MTQAELTALVAQATQKVQPLMEAGLVWDKPKEIDTKVGRRIVASTEPTPDFWDIWKKEKSALKKGGVSVSKFKGSWQVSIWVNPTDDTSEPEKSSGQGKDLGETQKPHTSPVCPQDEEVLAGAKDYMEELREDDFRAGELVAVPAQRLGISAIVGHAEAGYPAFLLADQMGSGKTLQAICSYSALLRKGIAKRAVVFCPASLCSMWQGRLEASGLSTQWVKSSKDIISGKERPDKCPSVIICNYALAVRDDISKQLKEIVDEDIMLILDEADKVKSSGFKPSKISQLIWGLGGKDWDMGLANKAKFSLSLTGTPTPNGKHSELHGFLTAAADTTKNYLKFGKHFCGLEKEQYGRRSVWVETEPTKNSDHFRELLAPHRLQRPVEVFAELPSISHTDHFCDASPSLLRQLAELELDVDAIESALLSGESPGFEQFATCMRMIGTAKVNDAFRMVRDLAENEPLVVFVRHKDVLSKLSQLLETHRTMKGGNPNLTHITMTSDMTGEQRGEAVRKFQEGKDIRVFLTTLGVAAEGITLTRANQSLMVELDFAPGRMAQAAARIHRIGQDKHCTIHHLHMQGTIDVRLANIIQNKTYNIKEIEK